MKILLVILHADATRGGAEGYALDLMRALTARGHDVYVAAADFSEAVPVERRVPLQHSGLTRSGRYRRFCRALDVHLRANAYDVIHSFLPVPTCDVYHPQAGIESFGWNTLPLMQRLGNARRRAFVAVERQLIEGSKPPMVLCLSERVSERSRHAFKIDRSRIVTLYNGVDENRFVPSETHRPWTGDLSIAFSRAAQPRFIFIGQDFARKGLDIAIRALAEFPCGTLRVVGRDNPAPFLALAESLSLQKRIDFAGPSNNVPNELQHADVLLLPAHHEPFGMVVVEAMLSGVVPIVSVVTGAAEVIHDSVNGRILLSSDPKAWAGAMRDVLNRLPAYRQACIDSRTTLSYQRHIDAVTWIYEQIIHQRNVIAE